MKNRTLFHWIIFVSLALTWGSSFILMKRGLDSFSSYQVAALRIFIAFLFLLPLAFRHIKKIHFKYLPAFIAMGVFGNLIPAFLFTQAETLISSALTGMLNSVTPVFALIIGLIMLKEKVKLLQIVGLATGIIGAIGLLSLGKNSESSGNIYLGGAMVLLATFFYGLSVNIIKAKLGNVSAVTATIFALCIVGPFAGIYLFTTDFIEVMQTKPLAFDSLKYVCILAIFGTSLSLIVFNILIKEAGTLFASSVTYFIPIVAMLWGALDGEAITVAHSIFIVVILAGVWLVNKK
ncbi:MAG: DMT family transporter [Bacteroidetes bacterium]|nr:DMT family transporter [Bacteroidota bacterium]PHX82448.1 MAG: EamA family transporter [Flavobacteriales bacterium]